MKFFGGLLIGIGIGFALCVLLLIIYGLGVMPYYEEQERVEDREKRAQEKLERQQLCTDEGGTWIVAICPSCPENTQCDVEMCNMISYCEKDGPMK